MANYITAKSELSALKRVLETIMHKGERCSRYLEINNSVLRIEYSEKGFKKFVDFKSIFLDSVGRTAKASLLRAERVYTNDIDRITKPSYFKRLNRYPDIYNGKIIEINQLDNIAYELAVKPNHSLLTFSIFRPVDLINKKRPGYVPCPVSGDFKFRKGKLHLNIFFRSNDALNFLYPDIYYLRAIQEQVLLQAKNLTRKSELKNGKVGDLTIHFSRVYMPIRMEMKKKDYINTKEVKAIVKSLISKL